MVTKINSRQIISNDTLDQLSNTSNPELDNLLRSVDLEINPPFRLIPNDAGNDRQLNIEPNIIANSETGRRHSAPPINGKTPKLASGGTIVLPATSGTITVTPSTGAADTITIGNSEFVKCIIEIDEDGYLSCNAGVAAASEDLALIPSPNASKLLFGILVVSSDGSGNIDNVEHADIIQLPASMGGGVFNLDIQQDGVSVDSSVNTINFSGADLTIKQRTSGVVDINIPKNPDIAPLEQALTKLALQQEYESFKDSSDGLVTELFLDHNAEDKTIETSSITLAQINGNMKEAPFDNNISDWFQNDRESEISPKSGILKPAYKPYYGECVDVFHAAQYLNTYFYGIAYDETSDSFFITSTATNTIIRVSSDFKVAHGFWKIDGASLIYDVCVDGNNLYVSDYNYSTYGRITKHTLSSDRTTIDGLSSGANLVTTNIVLGNATYNTIFGLTTDSTYLYAVLGNFHISRIDKVTFTAWDSSVVSLTSYAGGAPRGLAFDGTDFFVSDVTNNHIIKIKIDGSETYNKFYSPVIRALTMYKGDLFACESVQLTAKKIAIKNTRTLEGQRISGKTTPDTGIWDFVYVADLLGSGNHGYLTVNGTNREIAVYNDSWVEQTSGTPQTTVLGDSSGNGITVFWGIDSNGTNILLSGDGTTDSIIEIAISDLDGTYSLVAGNIKINVTGQNPRQVAYIPNEANKCVYYRLAATCITEGDLSGGTVSNAFETSTYFPAQLGILTFDSNNSNHLYIADYTTANRPVVVVDYALSRYMGDGNQPIVVKIAGKLNNSAKGGTFNGNGDLVTFDATNSEIVTLAVNSADDKNVTGLGQRNVRYYGRTYSTGQLRTYPSTSYNVSGATVEKMIRYRRKYAPSVYSDQNNVLPLDGLYILSSYGLSIIDLESNTEFMTFQRPETAGNVNMIDGTGLAVTYYDLSICDDKIFIGSSYYPYIIDFVNDCGYMLHPTNGLYKSNFGIKDRNLCKSLYTDYWQLIGNGIILTADPIYNVSCKQETTIKPEEHKGIIDTIDNGEIYIGYGSTGNGLIKWKAGISYKYATTSTRKMLIADDFTLVNVIFSDGTNGRIDILGDCRKIYTDNATIGWAIQTGVIKSFTSFSNRYFRDIDIKTVWKNGKAYNYIAIGEGQNGVSDIRAIQVLDVENSIMEDVTYSAASVYGYYDLCWGEDNKIYSLMRDNLGTNPHFRVFTRQDSLLSPEGNFLWSMIDYSTTNNNAYEYWHFIEDLKGISFSFNTLCLTSDIGGMIIEMPKGDSTFETKSFSLDQMNSGFYIANDSSGFVGLTGKVTERRIFGDVGDAKYTFTDGSVQAWGAVVINPEYFGGNYRIVLGQSGGGIQPKVEWTTEANCTNLYIYVRRTSTGGKIDVNVTNTSGVVNFEYDLYGLETLNQEIIVVKGLDSEVHSVTLTCRSDKNASSSGYWFSFEGCVEVVETATDRAQPTIEYQISIDQDESTPHFDPFVTEGVEQQLGLQELFSGDDSQVAFQVSAGASPVANMYKVELYTGGNWIEQIEGVDWTQDSADQRTVTFTVAPATASNNIRLSYTRKGTEGKIKVNFEYPAGSNGIEAAYVNDLGVYLQKL